MSVLIPRRPSLLRPSVRLLSTPAPPIPPSNQQPNDYCRSLTQQHDHPSYLTSYFYPRLAQPAFFALHAFNVELESIARKASQDSLRQMRYRWWKDAIKAVLEGNPPQHPVPLALHTAHTLHRLEPYHLNRLITAYSTPLPLSPTLSELLTHAQRTHSTLIYLCISILPPIPPSPATPDADRISFAASHAGQAVGLASVLRAAAIGQGSLGRTFQGGEERWKERVSEVGKAIKEELGRASEVLGEGGRVPREVVPAFLIAAPTRVYLERVENAGMDPRLPGARKEDWRTAWRVWRASRTRQI